MASDEALLPGLPRGGANATQRSSRPSEPPRVGIYIYRHRHRPRLQVVLMYAGLYFGHIKAVRTREADREDQRRRTHAVVSMRNLLAHEDKGLSAAAAAATAGSKARHWQHWQSASFPLPRPRVEWTCQFGGQQQIQQGLTSDRRRWPPPSRRQGGGGQAGRGRQEAL